MGSNHHNSSWESGDFFFLIDRWKTPPSHVPVTREGESWLFHKAAVSLSKEHQHTFIQVETVHRKKEKEKKKHVFRDNVVLGG